MSNQEIEEYIGTVPDFIRSPDVSRNPRDPTPNNYQVNCATETKLPTLH